MGFKGVFLHHSFTAVAKGLLKAMFTGRFAMLSDKLYTGNFCFEKTMISRA